MKNQKQLEKFFKSNDYMITDEIIISKKQKNNFGFTPLEMKNQKIYLLITFAFLGFTAYLDEQLSCYTLDIFTFFLPRSEKIKEDIYIPFASQVLSILVQIYFIFFSRHFTLKVLYIISSAYLIINFILYPIFFKFLSGRNIFAAVICILLLQGLFFGILGNISLMTISNFPREVIFWFSFSQGLVGFVLGIFKILIILFTYEIETNKKNLIESCLSFGFACLCVITEIILTLRLYRNGYFVKRMTQIGEIDVKEAKTYFNKDKQEQDVKMEEEESLNHAPEEDDPLIDDDLTSSYIKNIKKHNQNKSIFSNIEHRGNINLDVFLNNGENIEINRTISHFAYRGVVEAPTLKSIFAKIWKIDLLIFGNNFITFSIFPGICLEFYFFGLDIKWKTATIILLFNLASTIGRKIPSFIKNLNFSVYLWTSFPRIILCPLIFVGLFFEKSLKTKNIFASIADLIFILALGFSDGFENCTGFALAPEEFELANFKEKVGSNVCAFNLFGETLGMAFSFSLYQIVYLFEKVGNSRV